MPLSQKKLILADKDLYTQKIVKQILFILNCNDYDICNNIDIAITKFEANKYDFLILDMGFKSGQTSMDLIKYLYDKKESVPILVFSENIEDYRIELFKYSNASLTIKLLEKPSDPAEITESIKDCIELHSCKQVKTVLVPDLQKLSAGLQDQIIILREEVRILKEPTLKKAIPQLTLEFLTKNKEKIFAGISLLAAGLFTYYRKLLGFEI